MAAGYEGKKPGSGSVRGSVQEFDALEECKAAVDKLDKCARPVAEAKGLVKEYDEAYDCVNNAKSIASAKKDCESKFGILKPLLTPCFIQAFGAKTACGIASPFMTLMDSEVFDTLPFEDEEYEGKRIYALGYVPSRIYCCRAAATAAA